MMFKALKGLFVEEKGQGMTEYALIIGLIAIVVIGVLTVMGTTLKDKFNTIVNSLS